MGSTPSGWYADPDDSSQLRYWDGDRWTDHRQQTTQRVEEPAASPPFSGSGPGRGGGLGLAAARRLAESAKQSGMGHKVAESAATAGRSVRDAAKDPARRQAVVASAVPAFEAVLDGAAVRNKKGKVKIWRVARAAARPRKTVSRVGTGVVAATAGQVTAAGGGAAAAKHRVAPLDRDILAEWAVEDPDQALARWREGTTRFHSAEVDHTDDMRASARLMCELLAHCLVGDPILEDDDEIVETIGNTLTASFNGVGEEAWGDEDQRVVRLALAVARRFGIQPEELGGNGELDRLFDDPANRMRMAMSVAPHRWSCDLSVWFADGSSR